MLLYRFLVVDFLLALCPLCLPCERARAIAWVRVERNGTPARGVPLDAIPDARASPKVVDRIESH
jgi:hypothetical protein